MLSVRRGLVIGVLSLSLAAAQVAASAPPLTTEPVQIVAVNVTLTDQRVALDVTGIGFQNTAQFRVRNRSATARTFAIGGQKLRVAPKGYRILLITFELRGKYPYAVTPGAKTTYRGVFRVV